MAKSYNGLDRTEAFFAHYGRKGMKRGMNIYNPNYKPVGEKAQLQNKAVKAKETSGVKLPKTPGVSFTENVITENTITEKANRKPPSKKTSNVGSLSSTDPRYAAPSAKDRERAAMEAASKAGSAATAKRKAEERREKLLASERKRQAEKTADTASKDRSNREAEEKRQYESRLKTAKNTVNKWTRIIDQLSELAKQEESALKDPTVSAFGISRSPYMMDTTLAGRGALSGLSTGQPEMDDFLKELANRRRVSFDDTIGPMDYAVGRLLSAIQDYQKLLDEKKE